MRRPRIVIPLCQDYPMLPVPPTSDKTTCLVAGDGPAGMMLGLLLASDPVAVARKHLAAT